MMQEDAATRISGNVHLRDRITISQCFSTLVLRIYCSSDSVPPSQRKFGVECKSAILPTPILKNKVEITLWNCDRIPNKFSEDPTGQYLCNLTYKQICRGPDMMPFQTMKIGKFHRSVCVYEWPHFRSIGQIPPNNLVVVVGFYHHKKHTDIFAYFCFASTFKWKPMAS